MKVLPNSLLISQPSLTLGDSIISSEGFGSTYFLKWDYYLEYVARNGFACILMINWNASLSLCVNLPELGPIKHLVVALQANMGVSEFFLFWTLASFMINLFSILWLKFYSIWTKTSFRLKFLLKVKFQGNISEEKCNYN